MQAAERRHGPIDWSHWTFTTEEFGFGRQRILRFKVDENGKPTPAT